MSFVNQRLPKDALPSGKDIPNRASRSLLCYSRLLNVAEQFLDVHLREGRSAFAALRYNGRTWTYGHLAERVNRLANVLLAKGIVGGDRILIHLPNCAEFVESWLASLRIGAVVVASLPAYKRRELQFIITQIEPVCVITNEELWSELAELASSIELRIVVGNTPARGWAYEELLKEGSAYNKAAPTQADDYAIIAYTSGSTGSPKGTCHTHGDLLAIADTYAREILDPKPSDRFAGHPSMAFTYGLGGLLVFPLRFGASVVLDSFRFDPSRWLDVIIREGVTIFVTTPTACRLFLEERRCRSLATVQSIRHVVTAGEPLFEHTFAKWCEATGIELLEGCGSTEMLHIWISQRVGEIQPGCVGRPVQLFGAQLLDDRGEEINDVEAEGRIALQGPTGCRYWRQPELQRQAVINGSTLTGDRFRRDGKGCYWFVARDDDMILSGGYNISPVEVEEALIGYPEVRDAAVVGIPDGVYGQSVQAFVVTRQLTERSAALETKIRDFLRREIAPFKIPTRIHFVTALPRTSTGKVSRLLLRTKFGTNFS